MRNVRKSNRGNGEEYGHAAWLLPLLVALAVVVGARAVSVFLRAIAL